MKIIRLTAEQLRKSILQLAIRGKLVKQDPNDEPASELVKKIYAEKQKLIAEGKIKKDKNESFIYKGDDNRYYEKIGKNVTDITDELPFDIPDNWFWIRQENLCWLDNGIKSNGEKLPYLEAKVIRGLKKPDYFDEGIKVGPADKVILVDGENSGEIMEPPYVGYMGSTFKIFSAIKSFNYDFLLLIFSLNKDLYRNSKKGAAIPHLNKDLFKNLLIAIPPIAEQGRILEKIANLEPLFRQYEKLENELFELDSNLECKLKKSILQYAIEGKLVKQDPNDEPASVLLERIKAEKEKLIKEGKIKRDKNESIIYQGDDKNYYEKIGGNVIDISEVIPFEIPCSWNWMRLCSLCKITLGKTPERHDHTMWNPCIVPWISISDMEDKKVIYKTKELISDKALKLKFNGIKEKSGTLLLSFKLTVGRVSILGIDAVHNEAIASIIPYFNVDYITRNYLFYFLGILTSYCEKTDAIKGVTLNKEKLNNMLIPVPNLNEQKNIINSIKLVFNILN